MEYIFLYLNMEGYSFYIWSSYAVWLFFLLALIIKTLLRKKVIEKKLQKLKIKT